VAPILEDVRKRGDAALLEYARRFDGFEGESIVETTRAPMPGQLRAACGPQPPTFAATPNARCPSRGAPSFPAVTAPADRAALDSMAAYIPAGRYPLPSTLLMTIIPAQVAGVPRTYVASPHPSSEILAIAGYLKVTSMFRMGGAQAIAAFAFGTETVPRVDRIVAPATSTSPPPEAAGRRSRHRLRCRAHRSRHRFNRGRPAHPRGRHARAS
jgi:histidinol dehydrogenase